MAVQVLRMHQRAATTPYFAERGTFHRLQPFRLVDLIDIAAVVAGAGWHISHPGGEPRRRELVPGTMVLYRPNDEVLLRGSDPDGITLMYVSSPIAEWQLFSSMVGVDPAWLSSAEPPIVTFSLDDSTVLQPFATAIEKFRTGPTTLDLVNFWTGMIPTMFPSSHRTFAGSGAPAWIVDAVAEMRQEENLRGGLPRLLDLAHVSPAHLSATVRRFFDRTPTDLVTTLRVRHAAFLLASTSAPISEVARRCGFSSAAYFSRSFRRENGVSATEYRARSITRTLKTGTR